MFNKGVSFKFPHPALCALHNGMHCPLHLSPSSVYNLCGQGLTIRIRMHLHNAFSLVILCNCSPNDKGGAGYLQRGGRVGVEPMNLWRRGPPNPSMGLPSFRPSFGHTLALGRIEGGPLYDTPASLAGVVVRIPIEGPAT